MACEHSEEWGAASTKIVVPAVRAGKTTFVGTVWEAMPLRTEALGKVPLTCGYRVDRR